MNNRCRNNHRLTPTEVAVVRAIIDGHTTYVAIAELLIMSPKTVQGHLAEIYQKTHAVNMTALVLMALRLKPCAIDVVGQVAADEQPRKVVTA